MVQEKSLNAFLEAVKADETLQVKLKAAADAETVVSIANQAGFLISIEELGKLSELSEISELSPDELEGASGGRIGDHCSQRAKDILNNYTAAIWCRS